MDEAARYFEAERLESLVFVTSGAIALAVALWCWLKVRRPLHNGLAWALALVAAIQLGVGTTVFVRSPQDVKRVEQHLRHEPARIKSEEVPRMQGVMRNFRMYRWVEIALIVLGLALSAFASRGTAWRGAGAGLAVQGALMLALDFFAERRGERYLAFLLGT